MVQKQTLHCIHFEEAQSMNKKKALWREEMRIIHISLGIDYNTKCYSLQLFFNGSQEDFVALCKNWDTV